MRATNMLIKRGTTYALRRETKFIFRPKVRGVAKVRRLIPSALWLFPVRALCGLRGSFTGRSR